MKIKQIRPLEHNFTKKLDGIAVMPKMLYYYGALPGDTSAESPIGGRGRAARLHGGAPLGLGSSLRTATNEASPEVSFGDAPEIISENYVMPQKQQECEKLENEPNNIISGRECAQGGSPSPSADKSVATDLSDASLVGNDIIWANPRLKSVAIVGARKNTAYGEDVAFRVAYELAKRGVVIISGLAYGIDSIAHRGALAAGGVTIGVLGTSIDRIYPTRHVGLAEEMVAKGGAVISEYAPGTKMHAWRFLERNRIISGLSDVVIVVEANVRSGSLNTAMHALEQGRELFAVPGDINRPLSQGCNRLIAQGANPYTCVEDVLNFLFPGAEKKKKRRQMSLFGDNENETALLQALAKGVQSGEEILKETGMEASKYNQTVTMLEIKGRIRSLGMNRWTLC